MTEEMGMPVAVATAVAVPVRMPAPRHAPMKKGALGAWWAQGVRTALFMRPDWRGLQVSPANLCWLVLVACGAAIGLERLYIDGPARFYWPALMSSAVWVVVWAWTCWWVMPPVPAPADAAPNACRAPDGAGLLSMMLAQSLPITVCIGLLMLPMVQGELDLVQAFGPWSAWSLMVLPALWPMLSQIVLLWRGATARPRAKLAASVLLAMAMALMMAGDSYFRHWYPTAPSGMTDEDSIDTFELTQELIELQSTLMTQRLKALQPQRKNAIDVYAVTFAPYAEVDVFRRESQLVVDLMAERFDAQGRTIQLVNHREAAREWPWATPLNLQRVIRQVAQKMNREQDVLFLHLTSHGAQSGELAASFWPLEVDAVTPAHLKQWLDEAGIRHRIVSISACYSGSWIAPLADPDTLVMTAADAEHTSYGCGRRSELTFFGRAMYAEQLRQTRSFEHGHAQARVVIEQREKEAGKTDGYSNPQIAMGQGMREHLLRLEAQLDKSAPVR
ncbi:MAG TPA: C13 family peptidase [Ideonella sp.]|uniref:C13 family peptidase n=1 Tax=Ideonella sp. TaxID=1929293 RepID=UPI002E34E1D5|nr:C13 family peptidase [Ideonella sp.]HEX5684088.1 C13 family peptidase [Ideonella sp.]